MATHSTSIYANPETKPPLDESFYSLTGNELAFFKEQTGIKDESALKDHIIAVQKKAYNVYGYPCIHGFRFTTMKISLLDAYPDVLKLGKERQGAILLDIGCCFGNDVRKAVVDGWLVENAHASDLRPEFWGYGHELFCSTPTTFPATFIPGDVFSPAFILPHPPFTLKSTPPPPFPPTDARKSLTTPTPLQGHVSVLHASSFFHLFEADKQAELAHILASLLSPLPGSLIFGAHSLRSGPGGDHTVSAPPQAEIFDELLDQWRQLWDGEVFEKGSVVVKSRCHPWGDEESEDRKRRSLGRLVWSVTRV